MKVGIIGPVGAGKSEFAEALLPSLPGPGKILDGYVEDIEQESDLALGPWATYVGNTAVAIGRIARERAIMRDHRSLITCGTLADTIAYAAVDGVNGSRWAQNKEANYARVHACVTLLGALMSDTFDYKAVFYLPGEPVEEAEEIPFVKAVGRELPQVIEAFQIPAVKLDGATAEENVEKAVAFIKSKESDEAPQAD